MADAKMRRPVARYPQDIYHAKKQIVKALFNMAKAATHRTEGGIEQPSSRLKVTTKRSSNCSAGRPAARPATPSGIIEVSKSIVEEFKDTVTLEAGLVSAAGAVEHYEMAPLPKDLGEPARQER